MTTLELEPEVDGNDESTPDQGPRALTLWRPWGLLVMTDQLEVPKDVENRANLTTKWRGTLYLHSGKKWDPEGAQVAERLGLRLTEADVPTGYIGLVTLVDVHHYYDHYGVGRRKCSGPWWQPGMWHWGLEDRRPFETAFPGPGRQSLFMPDPEVVERTEQLLAR